MGDFMPIIYINYNLYYYGGFRAPNCLMTFVTHDAQRRPSELASAFSDLKVQSVASQSPCTAVVIVNQKYS